MGMFSSLFRRKSVGQTEQEKALKWKELDERRLELRKRALEYERLEQYDDALATFEMARTLGDLRVDGIRRIREKKAKGTISGHILYEVPGGTGLSDTESVLRVLSDTVFPELPEISDTDFTALNPFAVGGLNASSSWTNSELSERAEKILSSWRTQSGFKVFCVQVRPRYKCVEVTALFVSPADSFSMERLMVWKSGDSVRYVMSPSLSPWRCDVCLGIGTPCGDSIQPWPKRETT